MPNISRHWSHVWQKRQRQRDSWHSAWLCRKIPAIDFDWRRSPLKKPADKKVSQKTLRGLFNVEIKTLTVTVLRRWQSLRILSTSSVLNAGPFLVPVEWWRKENKIWNDNLITAAPRHESSIQLRFWYWHASCISKMPVGWLKEANKQRLLQLKIWTEIVLTNHHSDWPHLLRSNLGPSMTSLFLRQTDDQVTMLPSDAMHPPEICSLTLAVW